MSDSAIADLGRSGLDAQDAEALGARSLTAAEAQALGHQPLPAILFRYWDPFAGAFTPEATFHRVRYLESPSGFASQQAKPQRYSQPAGSLNDVYVPRRVEGKDFDWAGYLSAPAGPLYFTEGEKKAAKACKEGLPTLALGGVTMWRAQTRGVGELPTLAKIDFKGRDAYVVFDTDEDAGLKPEVLRAARQLMEHLLVRGATPSLVVLPAKTGKKVGFDDYLVLHGRQDFLDYAAAASTGMSDAAALCEAAAHYAYVQDVDRFVSLSNDDEPSFMTVDHADHVLEKREVSLPRLARVKVQGGGFVVRSQPHVTRVVDALLMWPGSGKFSCSVYRPGLERTVTHKKRRMLNLWTGWRSEYDEGTLHALSERERVMGEWNWALDNVFGDDAAARDFVHHWILYPLKHAGAKLYTFALVSSPEQGIGKSFIGHMLAKHVYGLMRPGPRHAWQLSEGDLQGQFNPYLHAVSFVEGDDITATDKKSVYERVKSFVTSDTVQVNLKNTPQFMIENRANFWLTSNDSAPFFLTDQDRRAFVHVPKKAVKNDARYHALELDFESGLGGQALLWYARERYDQAAFDPRAPAPDTAGRREVTLNSRGALRDWASGLVASPETLTRTFATPKELFALMQMELPGAERYSFDALAHALRDAGARRWNDGALVDVRTESGARRRERVWVVDPRAPVQAREAVTESLVTVAFNRRPPPKDGDKVVPIRPPPGGKKY